MKLRDYKSLLTLDKNAAMLFDLTERFPRGPEAKLRDRDYKNEDGDVLASGWGSNKAPYLNRGIESAEGSDKTGGWNPYEIYELDDDEWRCAQVLRGIEVPIDMAMAKNDTWGCDEGNAKLLKQGAQITRRARRMANRIRRAKEWVKANIGTAVYRVSVGGWRAEHAVYVHADDEAGALTQFELFMKGGFNEHCEDYDAERITIHYERPAKTPLELMALNAPFQERYRTLIEKKKKTVERLLKEIEAMDMCEQVVNIYAVNMVATWGTGEGENADA
ncbi:MAG: hypothetical protein VX294_04625 [Candidatus Latescibacterota bacterium]|nr:hypothetical protein [Candidatus Latescibacterota bacterium]